MIHLIQAVEKSVAEKNWYAAFALALTLPDICAKAENAAGGSQARYAKWVDKYLTPKYTNCIGADRREHVFLSGRDLYALRCAFLHEGSDSTMNQRAKESIEKFIIIAPKDPDFTVHCNQLNNYLQLQVDILCTDICASVREWLEELNDESEAYNRVGELMEINEFGSGEGFSF